MKSKNNRISFRIVIIAIITLFLTGFGVKQVIAYFITEAPTSAINVGAATIDIKAGDLKPANGRGVSNLLPGESFELVAIDDGVNIGGIKNTGSRSSIIELDFNLNTIGKLYYTSKADFDKINDNPLFTGDYIFEPSQGNPNFGEVYYSEKRLNEVIKIVMSKDGTKWVESDGKFYIHAKKNEVVKFGKIVFYIEKELGGISKVSPDRQFEQQSLFSMAYGIRAVQATSEAIKDEFGVAAHTEISKLHGIGSSDTWFDF